MVSNGIILVIFGFGFGILFWFLERRLSKLKEELQPEESLIEWLKTTQQTTQQSIQAFHREVNQRLDNAARVIAQVQKNIGEMSEIGRTMQQLQEFLTSPKLRGNIGEQVLREILGQMLPKHAFHLQYRFRNGAVVDAAIKTQAGIIPIDSKFPMENFRKLSNAKEEKEKEAYRRAFLQDVRKHIGDIARKYILTEEGTLDYALMYIPSEAVYYEVINSDPNILEYAYQKRVLPVSPTTFYAYLRAILMSFEGQKIEARARQILRVIRALQQDYARVEGYLSVLNRHLTNAYNQMNNVLNSFNLLGQKLSSTAALPEPEEVRLSK